MNIEIVWIAVSVGISITMLAVMGIVIACLTYSYQRAKLGKPNHDALPQVDEETRAELAQLRSRVATLERLVTDDDRRLAGEIARLSRTEISPPA
jgi:hypothetical protein